MNELMPEVIEVLEAAKSALEDRTKSERRILVNIEALKNMIDTIKSQS